MLFDVNTIKAAMEDPTLEDALKTIQDLQEFLQNEKLYESEKIESIINYTKAYPNKLDIILGQNSVYDILIANFHKFLTEFPEDNKERIVLLKKICAKWLERIKAHYTDDQQITDIAPITEQDIIGAIDAINTAMELSKYFTTESRPQFMASTWLVLIKHNRRLLPFMLLTNFTCSHLFNHFYLLNILDKEKDSCIKKFFAFRALEQLDVMQLTQLKAKGLALNQDQLNKTAAKMLNQYHFSNVKQLIVCGAEITLHQLEALERKIQHMPEVSYCSDNIEELKAQISGVVPKSEVVQSFFISKP